MREFAKASEVNVGDTLEADGGFTCLCEGDRKPVMKNVDNRLYIECNEGKHFLEGQEENGVYIGLYRAEG